MKGGEIMDFEFDVDMTEFDKDFAELNEAMKEIDLTEYDKILNEIMPN